MDKEKREDKKLSITLIIFIFIFVLTLIPTVVLCFINIDLSNKYTALKDNNQKEEKINEEKILKQNELTNKIDKLNNINNDIDQEKEEYFKTIKELEDKIIKKESDKKIAYLTFDDGPYYLTNKYLEVLDKYDVKATFFTIGLDKEKCFDNRSEDCSIMYKKIVENGHTIANHTYSHGIWYGLYSSSNSFINQVKKQENLIKEKTGVVTNIVRFPGGSATAGSKKNEIIEKLRDNNYGWVDWTASNGDGGGISSKEMAFSNFKKTINQDIEVILLHDYSYITLSILPDIIEYLQDNDYILLPLFYESNMVNK